MRRRLGHISEKHFYTKEVEVLPPRAWQTIAALKARESGLWALNRIEVRDAFKCKVPCCRFSATTSHDLATHISMCHKNLESKGPIVESAGTSGEKKRTPIQQETPYSLQVPYKQRLYYINPNVDHNNHVFNDSLSTHTEGLQTSKIFNLGKLLLCTESLEIEVEEASDPELQMILSGVQHNYLSFSAILLKRNIVADDNKKRCACKSKSRTERLCTALSKLAGTLPGTDADGLYYICDEKNNNCSTQK